MGRSETQLEDDRELRIETLELLSNARFTRLLAARRRCGEK
jgi:hypothetical protein